MHPQDNPHILVANHAPEILELVRELLEAERFRITTQPRQGQHVGRIAELAPERKGGAT